MGKWAKKLKCLLGEIVERAAAEELQVFLDNTSTHSSPLEAVVSEDGSVADIRSNSSI